MQPHYIRALSTQDTYTDWIERVLSFCFEIHNWFFLFLNNTCDVIYISELCCSACLAYLVNTSEVTSWFRAVLYLDVEFGRFASGASDRSLEVCG